MQFISIYYLSETKREASLDKEAEDAYNERQNQPLLKPTFTSAKAMIPDEQIQQQIKDEKCLNEPKGCKINVLHKAAGYCPVCKMLLSIGTEFFIAEKEVSTENAFAMNDWQNSEHERLHKYWTSWMENFPRGAQASL